MTFSEGGVTALIVTGSIVGLITAAVFTKQILSINIHGDHDHAKAPLVASERAPIQSAGRAANEDGEFHMELHEIAQHIADGANAFLTQEYKVVSVFMALFGLLLFIVLGASTHDWGRAALTVFAFIAGAVTSIISGYIGMSIAVRTNSRTALSAAQGLRAGRGYELAYDTSFKGGAVMGFALVALGLIVLYILMQLFTLHWKEHATDKDAARAMYEALAGYGLGGSSIALFGRVGGGIYTKAADVGADLAGKVEAGLKEDDPRNPAVIADNVGDNVGDIAGMGADLFGSFAESSCAAMVIASQSELFSDWAAISFPLLITAAGIFVSLVTAVGVPMIKKTRTQQDVEPSLKYQLIVSTVLMTPVIFALSHGVFPSTFDISTATDVKNWHIFFCVAIGLWSGLFIGLTTEYYTSHSYEPVREVSRACRTGAATNIIYGLALGYKSTIIPVFLLAITMYVGLKLAGMYGIAVAALGILSTLSVSLAIDGYGPICDNAGGIAEMSGMPEEVREITDSLDAAGNTTAAIGKGFAIGSAALVSLALFGAFVTIVFGNNGVAVDILNPFTFAGLLFGAMLPYWFSALTMKSVGKAAYQMVDEVRAQFANVRVGPDGTKDFTHFRADYKRCVAISTKASLQEMIAPGLLVLLSPIIVGFFFGVNALAGVLVGALVSGVQMAISASNTGGAWDNAKKYIEAGGIEGERKGGNVHKAAVIGDTVGDPLKDTSGPSLNILIKLMAIISVVFGPSFFAPGNGLLERFL